MLGGNSSNSSMNATATTLAARMADVRNLILQTAERTADAGRNLGNWVSAHMALHMQSAASTSLATLATCYNELQASLAPQPAPVYGPPALRSMQHSAPVNAWALHMLAHTASRPQLLQQMATSVPYAIAEEQVQQVMQAAVQGRATLAGATPSAAAQALREANAAIADLMTAVQRTLRPLQRQSSTTMAPAAANTTCSMQESPAGLTATAPAAPAAPAVPTAAPAAPQCMLPAVPFTQCNVDPAAPGVLLSSCPATACKCRACVGDGLCNFAAQSLKTVGETVKRSIAPAAAWTTAAVSKAKVRRKGAFKKLHAAAGLHADRSFLSISAASS